MRKLASIQRIANLEPIEGADTIEKATVLGWQLVVKRGEFQIDDLCVYCEIDSILPEKAEFEFLRQRKFRIKTIRLRGQVSQGICFQLSILPKGTYNEGDDVTAIMGVKKHDPQAEAERLLLEYRTKVHNNRINKFLENFKWYRRFFVRPDRLPFPSFIKKTDEDRIQLFPDICEKEKDTVFQITEKLDGQSASYFVIKNWNPWQFWKPYIFGVCSRNFQLLIPNSSSYWTVANMLGLKKRLTAFCRANNTELVVQGEIIGHKIQNNKYQITGYDFYVFNIAVPNVSFIKYNNFQIRDICSKLGLKYVPAINDAFKLPASLPEMVELSKGISVLYNVKREGLVLRNSVKNISFKVINPDFLLEFPDEG